MKDCLLRFLAFMMLLWASPSRAEPVAGNAEAGAQTFQKVCSACHSVAEGARHRVGPNLYDVVGKPAAGRGDYPYTIAFKNSKIIWDDKALSAFLAGPGKFIPGTKMDWVIENSQDIVDVIAYLKQNAP
jgi:cytochrome c